MYKKTRTKIKIKRLKLSILTKIFIKSELWTETKCEDRIAKKYTLKLKIETKIMQRPCSASIFRGCKFAVCNKPKQNA